MQLYSSSRNLDCTFRMGHCVLSRIYLIESQVVMQMMIGKLVVDVDID